MSSNKVIGKLEGQNIVSIEHSPYKYDDYLIVTDDKGERFKMNVEEFNILLNSLNFDIIQKSVHKWLKLSEIYNTETEKFEVI
jgi:uncharacterized protein YxjI